MMVLLLTKEPVTPLVHVPTPVYTNGVRRVYRQVA